MRINYVLLGFAIIISVIIAYAFSASGLEVSRSIIVGIVLVLYLGSFMSVSIIDKPRPTALIRVVGSLSFFIFIIMNVIFNITGIGNQGFYITNLLFVVLTLLLMYGLAKAKM